MTSAQKISNQQSKIANPLEPMMNQILVYQSEVGRTKLDVRLENQPVWPNRKHLTELFTKAKVTISEHIKRIFEDEGLTQGATVRLFRTVQKEADREILENAGKISGELGRTHAELEFVAFRKIEDRNLESDFDRVVKQLPSPTKDRP